MKFHLMAEDPDGGGEPLESHNLEMPTIPRVGEKIELWDPEGGWLSKKWKDGQQTDELVHSGEAVYAIVEDVTYCAYAPERIVVFVRFEAYDVAAAARLFKNPWSTP